MDFCNKILEIDSLDLNAYLFAAEALMNTGQFDEATKYAQKGIAVVNERLSKKDFAVYTSPDSYISEMDEIIKNSRPK